LAAFGSSFLTAGVAGFAGGIEAEDFGVGDVLMGAGVTFLTEILRPLSPLLAGFTGETLVAVFTGEALAAGFTGETLAAGFTGETLVAVFTGEALAVGFTGEALVPVLGLAAGGRTFFDAVLTAGSPFLSVKLTLEATTLVFEAAGFPLEPVWLVLDALLDALFRAFAWGAGDKGFLTTGGFPGLDFADLAP